VPSRYTISSLDLDRQIKSHLEQAEREVRAAMGVARQGRRVVGGPLARRTERDLGVLVRAIESVRSLSKADAQTDPDLIPEDVRAQEWRETREVTRQARLTAIQGSESPARGDG